MSLPRRLGILLLGLLLLVGAGWRLLAARPLAAVPPLADTEPAGQRPGFGEPAAGVLLSARPQRVTVEESGAAAGITPPLTDTLNILLVGIDTRADATADDDEGPRPGARTDALTVLVIDEKSPHLGLVSIPRDLQVQLNGREPERINSIYSVGAREAGEPRAGDALLRQVIRETLGLPIAHSVYVDYRGFELLVDQLEGISVNVRCPIRDRFLDGRGPDGRLELSLPAGVQHLDGRTALMYARSRHGRGVFDRATRQQALLVGLRERLLELGTTRLAQLLPILRKTVYTDLRTLDLLRLGRRLLGSQRVHLHGLVLGPGQAEPLVEESGRWVMIPRPDEIRRALQDLFKAPLPGQRQSPSCPDMDIALKKK